MKTLRQIIKEFGGAEDVSSHLGGTPKAGAIMRWYTAGIPERYWSIFITAKITTIQELHFLNEQARSGVTKSKDLESALWLILNDPVSSSYFSFFNKQTTQEVNHD